jgi:hypothetical protein
MACTCWSAHTHAPGAHAHPEDDVFCVNMPGIVQWFAEHLPQDADA